MSSWSSAFFSRPLLVFAAAILLRIALLVYGRWQDAHSPVKYTDIDYLVFTDAARFIAQGRSPYDRATYRYTPLLAHLLLPTVKGGIWFDFGKVLFAAGDIVTGWLILLILRQRGMPTERAMKFASIWLLNPMVANISTRGSSEGLVVVPVIALLWAVLQKRMILAGALLGLGVHFKIYPFIYAASTFWWLGPENLGSVQYFRQHPDQPKWVDDLRAFFNRERRQLAVFSFLVFAGANLWMFYMYKIPFLRHTFLYHFTRIDHRHNFSIYNTVLHLNSAHPGQAASLKIESLAFAPQLFLSILAIPVLLAKRDLPSTMLAQTFAFVTFNKVCTSQVSPAVRMIRQCNRNADSDKYFLWYMVFLPFYLPTSSLLGKPRRGIAVLALWVLGQAAWLQQGYELEFLGRSTFVPGLWLASVAFFLINCWILGIIIHDIRSDEVAARPAASSGSKKTS